MEVCFYTLDSVCWEPNCCFILMSHIFVPRPFVGLWPHRGHSHDCSLLLSPKNKIDQHAPFDGCDRDRIILHAFPPFPWICVDCAMASQSHLGSHHAAMCILSRVLLSNAFAMWCVAAFAYSGGSLCILFHGRRRETAHVGGRWTFFMREPFHHLLCKLEHDT